MAGKAKKKLDYAGWSVDIFDNDVKIDRLLDAQGWTGFGVYFYLCQKAFGSEGYFYRWGYDDGASTARKMGCGMGSGTIREIVGYCLQIGLFDKGLFDRWGVLTSRGIQKSYWAVAANRRDKTVYKELWLLQNDECKGVIFVPFLNQMSDTNDHSQATNSDESATNDTVVKESKVKDNKKIVATQKRAATFSPESFEMVCVRRIIDSVLRQMPGAKVPSADSEMQKWAAEIEKMQRIDRRSRKEIEQALNYAIKSTFWQSNIRSTKKFREKFETLYLQSKEKISSSPQAAASNRFHNFYQRDVDYDALVAAQLKQGGFYERTEGGMAGPSPGR